MLYGGIEDIAMEEPGLFTVQVKYEFIYDIDVPHLGFPKTSQFLVVVAGNVIDLGAFCGQGNDLFDNQ